jgi:hypothetical protein
MEPLNDCPTRAEVEAAVRGLVQRKEDEDLAEELTPDDGTICAYLTGVALFTAGAFDAVLLHLWALAALLAAGTAVLLAAARRLESRRDAPRD